MPNQQTNNTTNVVNSGFGLTTDLHTFNQDGSMYSFALNAIASSKAGKEYFLQNESSNKCSVAFPPNYQSVAFKEIPELNRVIYFLANPTNGGSQIGEVLNCDYKDITDIVEKVFCINCPEYKATEQTPWERKIEQCYCQYKLIVSSPCLGFNIHYPVDIEYKITNCQLQLYFTDYLSERRFLYFDFVDNDLTQSMILNEKFKVCESAPLCTCPDGYTFDELSQECIKLDITPIIPSTDQRVACAASDNSYANFGVAIYTTYNTNGTGTSTIHHAADTYWSNPAPNFVDGVLNRTAVWACNPGGTPQTGLMLPVGEPIGFIFPVIVPTTKTYYVGIAGDNKVRIRVGCNTIVDMDPNAIGLQYGTGLAGAFKFWHVYPVTLTAGRHVFELTGINFGSVAGFGAEIYDNTEAELSAATNGAGLNIIFSTSTKRGQPLQVSSTFVGTCPDGNTCVDIDDQGNLFCIVSDSVPADCDSCKTTVCSDELDCDKIKYNSNLEHPCIASVDVINGGNLPAGVYQILLAYADSFGNSTTQYFSSSQTIPIFINPITFETNYITNKAIHFKIQNLKNDSIFRYYNIVIAQTVDNFTEFVLVGTFSTNQTSYTYTGFEKSPKRLDSTEVFFKRPYYEKARGIASSNNYLFFTGVTEYETLNLQPVANKIALQWQTVALKEKAYYDPRNTFYFHTFQRDEVYPWGVIFEFGNGRETCAFHVPGRIATATDLQTIDNNDVITDTTCATEPRNKRWQVYNTAKVISQPHEYSETCDDLKCWEYGDFAYWESTETYPKVREVWGELCGKPIRHHKFPDNCISHIHDGQDDSKVYKDNNYIFPIGVRVNHQSVLTAIESAVTEGIITQTQADSITGYRLVRGNRVGNKSIDAKGLMFNMWRYTRDGENYYYPNYPYNDLHSDDFLAPTSSTYNGSTTSSPHPSSYYGGNDRFTFHSPDVHFVNTGLGDILKLETNEYGQSEGYFTHSDCQAKHKFPSTASHAIALGFGVAAALTATGERECRVIEYKSDYVTKNGTEHVASATFNGGQNITGAGTTTITTTNAGGSIGSHDITQDDSTEIHNNSRYDIFDPTTGAVIPQGNILNPDKGDTKTITTCKGQTYQLINSNLIVNGILGFGGAGVGAVIQKVILGIIEAGKVLDTIKVLLPYKNYSTQYNSVGKYNNYTCLTEGNKRRRLYKTAYLDPIIQNIDEPSSNPTVLFETVKVNNWERESSVYLKIDSTNSIPAPPKSDNSRVTMDQVGLGFGDIDVRFNRDISSYYASIKRDVLDQYGQLCNIEYLETNSCSFKLPNFYTDCEAMVFGGDTFINRFALKRKLPFFLHTMCGLANGSDVKYSDLGNVAFPNYYFNTEEPLFERMANLSISFADLLATVQAIVGTNQTRLDAKTAKFFYQNGYAHLFSYGIPYFFVESDINVDYRHGQNNLEKDFYPHNSDLKQWFEEANVPIAEDNRYFYNRTYSKQNKETAICTSCILDIKQLTCQNPTDNNIIYSESDEASSKTDNWLVFKANNYYDKFSSKLGRLISADGIESDKVLLRFTQGTQIFNAYNTIQATGETIQVGTGGLFQSRPQDLATTKLGHAGTQHKDILNTEFGHVWGDANKGQIFNLGTNAESIDELTKDHVTNWFKENLPFHLQKDFPDIALEDLDNNLYGIGLHFCFDKRFKRFLVTKLDYKVIDKTVKYNKTTKTFYVLGQNDVQNEVKLKDKRYFCDKSWTISYSFTHKTWTSWHTYHPKFYVQKADTFESEFTRLNTQKLYTHNVTNKSYQVFYGRLEPFVVEVLANKAIANNFVDNFEYSLDVIRYHNEFDEFYNRAKTFNKAILYNERQCSGLLSFVVSNPEDLTQTDQYPKRTAEGYDILTTNSENIWRFNDFWDVVNKQTNNLPFFNYDCNNVNKQLNYKALNNNRDDLDRAGLRQRMLRVRLTNDAESLYQFILHFGIINQTQSIR